MTLLESPPAVAPAARPRRPRRRRRRLLIVLLLVVALLTPVGVSYGQALTAPGYASFSARSIDWIRGHGGESLVNWGETYYYTHHQPATTGPPTDPLPVMAGVGTRTVPGPDAPVTLPMLPGVTPLPGEGLWHASAQRAGGLPASWTAYFRPDPGHTSVMAGVSWLDQRVAMLHLIPGTVQPGGTGWAENYSVPAGERSALVAAFNSGFKFKDAHGGYYVEGREVVPLRDGAASLVIDRSGTATIGVWGRDVRMTPDVVAVRQNLAMVVEGAKPVPTLMTNNHDLWGSTRSQFQYTWRSGLGTDRAGNLVYVAGQGLSLQTLAEAMAKAGVVTGMQLDIHTNMVTYSTFAPNSTATYGVRGQKLLPAMPGPTDRFLMPDQRDFVAIVLRPDGSTR